MQAQFKLHAIDIQDTSKSARVPLLPMSGFPFTLQAVDVSFFTCEHVNIYTFTHSHIHIYTVCLPLKSSAIEMVSHSLIQTKRERERERERERKKEREREVAKSFPSSMGQRMLLLLCVCLLGRKCIKRCGSCQLTTLIAGELLKTFSFCQLVSVLCAS